jgi:hypothetical protein
MEILRKEKKGRVVEKPEPGTPSKPLYSNSSL